MALNPLQKFSFVSRLTAVNGLNTFYFCSGNNRFKYSRKLRIYCFFHHLLCGVALTHMLYYSWGNFRLAVFVLTMGGTCVFCINTCWEKSQGLRKVAKGLIRLEAKYFAGLPSGSALRIRYHLKLVFASITLLRILLFYPIYLRRQSVSVLNIASYCLVYNMLLAAVFGFYSVVWQVCRSQKLINNRMEGILTKQRQRHRLGKLRQCLKAYGKLLNLCDAINFEYGHVSVCVLACKSWFQITYGYEIYQMVAAPKSIDMSLPLRVFVVLSYVLDAFNLYFATDVAEMFTNLRKDSGRILRETNRLDRLLSMFTLRLSLHPKRIVFLNVFAFDRKLTLTLMAKSMLYTICWLQGDYKKLKP